MLPFVGEWWIGELPLLALVQVPKLALAEWFLKEVVLEVIRWLGLARSASPDRILGRPYGLGLAYLWPLGTLVAVIWLRTGLSTYRLPLCILAFVAVVDFVCTLVFAQGRSLT